MTDDTKALVERLRGIYRVPIADGLGTAGGPAASDSASAAAGSGPPSWPRSRTIVLPACRRVSHTCELRI